MKFRANAFDPSSSAAFAEGQKKTAPPMQFISEAEHHGKLGADHRQVGADGVGVIGEGDDIGEIDGGAARHRGNPGVPRHAEDFGDEGALANLPGKGMLAPAATDDQDLHDWRRS